MQTTIGIGEPGSGSPPPKRRALGKTVAAILLFFVGLVCVPVVAGAGIYLALDGTLADLSTGVVAYVNTPRFQQSTVQVPEWSGRERVNILLLGTDQREGETSAPRTDTIIVATLDPQTKSAGMVSLPRDLWVTIPGYGNERINAAYELGELSKKGGGPELARKTVEHLLGVPIHHYALIGFAGFQKLVDQVGGVVIDVERPIKDDEYPDRDYSVRRIFFQPGLQRLNGEAALWYVRTRHADSDFGRARRQQQFLLALRKQALQLNLLPKAPAILATLSDTIKTDLRPSDMLALAHIAKDLDSSKLVNHVIDETMTRHWVTPAGAMVEVPDREAVKRVVQEVFGAAQGSN
jgi:polyisoprenyl-teichoic acid--peptidoglycan teichoic acid transferase